MSLQDALNRRARDVLQRSRYRVTQVRDQIVDVPRLNGARRTKLRLDPRGKVHSPAELVNSVVLSSNSLRQCAEKTKPLDPLAGMVLSSSAVVSPRPVSSR